MKRFSFLQVVVLAALLVTVASCGTPMGAEGGYYDGDQARTNVYYGDPYYGGVNTIVVQRNPYTGQYYQVSPGLYGGVGVYAAPAYGYYGHQYYGGGNRYYNNRNYNNGRTYNSGGTANGYYRTNPQRQQTQRAPVQQRPQYQQQRSEAKGAFIGGRRH